MPRKTSGPTRYAIYLRCSDDDQAQGDCTTIDTQREINALHVAQGAGALAGEYTDEGRTGTNLKRPGWKALLRDAEAGLFDVVCCTYMSRLARGDAHTVAEWQLREFGVRVEYVKEKFTEDMAGYVNKQMTRFMDGMYPKMVSGWVTTKMEQMAKSGYFCGGSVPFGYRSEPVEGARFFGKGGQAPPRRLVPDPEAAAIVRRAYEIFVATGSVADAQIYLRSATPRRWLFSSVVLLLRNPVYRGVLEWNTIRKEDAHEAIVSEGLWDMAQEVERSRTRRPKQKPVEVFPYYLRGLVWCPHCGCRMTPVWGHGRSKVVHYYECISSKKKVTVCPVRRVNAVTLHQAVVECIAEAARRPSQIRRLMSQAVKALPARADLETQLAESRRSLADVTRRIARCQEAIEESRGSLRPLVERMEALETERTRLEAECLQRESFAESQRVPLRAPVLFILHRCASCSPCLARNQAARRRCDEQEHSRTFSSALCARSHTSMV